MATVHALSLVRDPVPDEAPSSAEVIHLPDGSAVRAEGSGAVIHDPEGRVIVRYANGSAEIVAPSGDVTLSAPKGRVRIEAAQGVEVHSSRVDVTATTSRVTLQHAEVLAERIVTSAASIAQTAERVEVTATKIIERARDTYREVADLAQTRAGRLRTLVKDTFDVHARRTTMVSKDETAIDGSKVLLG